MTATGPATAASVTALGADMFRDAGSDRPDSPGTTVPSGTQIWLKQTGQSAALLQATAKATVPQNNVYLYDGTNSVPDAQRLILAQDATLTTTVNAKALFTRNGFVDRAEDDHRTRRGQAGRCDDQCALRRGPGR